MTSTRDVTQWRPQADGGVRQQPEGRLQRLLEGAAEGVEVEQ